MAGHPSQRPLSRQVERRQTHAPPTASARHQVQSIIGVPPVSPGFQLSFRDTGGTPMMLFTLAPDEAEGPLSKRQRLKGATNTRSTDSLTHVTKPKVS